MEKGWIVVYSTNQIYKAEMLKDVLFDNNIDCVILNKQDSAYPVIGTIEILVKSDDVIPAMHLINKTEF